jgi:signal transduction histidine kinase/CheY-like chemotaxis protein
MIAHQLSFRPFIVPFVIYLVGVILFAFTLNYFDRNRIMEDIDSRLVFAAQNAKFILPDNFHDVAVNQQAISDSMNIIMVRKLTEYAKSADLSYVYTAVLVNGKVHFTSSSASDEDIRKNDLPYYWQEYPEATPEFISTFFTEKTTLESSVDRWGTFRSAIVCVKSPAGNKYLIGADMNISFINQEMFKNLRIVLIYALFFLLIVTPFFFVLGNTYKKNTHFLEEQIHERRQAEKRLEQYKSHLEEIIRTRTEQLQEEINERKAMEVALESAKETAIKESRAKSAFLANMSHEIRTPMNGVIGMTNILKDTTLTDEQREYVDIIELSGNNLLNIINDILDFSKIEAGQVELEHILFSLPQQIDEVIKILHVRAEAKGLKLLSDIGPGIPSQVKGDPMRFKQIIINLTNNALKFTLKGSVTISLKAFLQNEEKIKIKCMVTDTGMGISDKARTKLFMEFSQTDASISRKYGGSGLGLKISKDLAHLMGGEIGVESEEGKGSVFWFTCEFEKLAKEEIERLTSDDHKSEMKMLSILLVEDDFINQKVATTSLDRDGYKNVDIAGNGKIAVKMVSEKYYDIILMDIRMPVMDGVEATERIREIERLESKRKPAIIVAFTAYAVEGDRERFLSAGMDDYIAKPFQPEELLRVIEKYANRMRLHSLPALKILLAEDNKINQKVAMKTLENFGHVVELAENGFEAVEKAKLREFDLVLMDLEMPVMDGIEATRIIRKMEHDTFLHGIDRKRMKIVALTAHSTVEDRTRCEEAGMDDYISKPFRHAELERALII